MGMPPMGMPQMGMPPMGMPQMPVCLQSVEWECQKWGNKGITTNM